MEILPGSQRVRVEVGGVTVAESTRPTILLEERCPTRYYLPMDDVRIDLLTPTGTVSCCPHKGQAVYWSARTAGGVRPDVAWSYPDPVPGAKPIAGLICFYNERADLFVDGVPEPRPARP